MLNVANNWIILKSWHNNMYGTKWSNLIYILVFWLQITVRTVACIVYEPVSRNIKQIYEHGNIYKIKRQNHFKGFLRDRKYNFQSFPLSLNLRFFSKCLSLLKRRSIFEYDVSIKPKVMGLKQRFLSISTSNGFHKVVGKK